LGRGAGRKRLTLSGLARAAGFALVPGFGLAGGDAFVAAAALAPGFALLVGFALARGLALPISGLALGLAAFLGAGRLPLAADFFAVAFLAADFLAGAFSGLVLGSGYVSAWVPS